MSNKEQRKPSQETQYNRTHHKTLQLKTTKYNTVRNKTKHYITTKLNPLKIINNTEIYQAILYNATKSITTKLETAQNKTKLSTQPKKNSIHYNPKQNKAKRSNAKR